MGGRTRLRPADLPSNSSHVIRLCEQGLDQLWGFNNVEALRNFGSFCSAALALSTSTFAIALGSQGGESKGATGTDERPEGRATRG